MGGLPGHDPRYTREAGVRALERQIAKVCRKMVKAFALGERESGQAITPEMLADVLGEEVQPWHC